MSVIYANARSLLVSLLGADAFRWDIEQSPAWFNGLIFFATFLLPPLLLVTEAFQWFQLEYSKFGHGGSLPSRLGMTIAYGGGFVLSFLANRFFGIDMSITAAWVIVWLVRLHFIRRMTEILFVHRYSGKMGTSAVAIICNLYSTLSVITSLQLSLLSVAEIEQLSQRTLFPIGIAIFLLGAFINSYHHILLASLRRPNAAANQQQYAFPKGGLFKFVVCPHYLGEIITFFGFALVFPYASAWSTAIATLFYLSGRSMATLAWYKKNKLIPHGSSRKRLIPFLF